MHRSILAAALAIATAGCGAGSLLQSPEDRKAEVAAAVTEALAAARERQANPAAPDAESLVAGQRAAAARADEAIRRTAELEDRLAGLAPRASPGAAGRAPAVHAAELAALRRDLDAMTGAVAQLLAERDRDEAATRARFERLEHRTSRLGWPDGGGERAVHLASYRTHEAALLGWEILQDRHRIALGPEVPTFVEVDTVAGRYVRLFVAVGAPERQLDAIRDRIRRGGDYAMVMPLPAGPGS